MVPETTALVPLTERGLQVHDRQYPLLLRTSAPPVQTQFDEMRRALVRSASLSTFDASATPRRGLLEWLAGTEIPRSVKARLFAAYPQDLAAIQNDCRAAEDYLRRAAQAAVTEVEEFGCARCANPANPGTVFSHGVCMYCGRREGTGRGRPARSGFPARSLDQRGVLKPITLPPLPHAPAFGIEAARSDPEAIRRSMVSVLERIAGSFVESLVEALDLAVDERQFGLLATDPEGNVRYHFYTIRPSDVELWRESSTATSSARTARGTVHTTTETTTRDVERTVTLRYHAHDLIDVRVDPIGLYTGRVPARVRPLLDRVPAALAPFLTVVSGNQIREVTADMVIARDVRTESTSRIVSRWVSDPVPVFRPDPAIVLGGVYVLAGWGEEER
jgi:hypothetical protein